MKRLALILITIIVIALLVSCGEAEAPDGMQLCYGSDADGYYMYSPEEWTNSNAGGVHASYVSRVNTSSVSFAEIEIEPEAISTLTPEEYFFAKYFTDSLKEFPSAPEITVNGENTIFGKEGYGADKAVKYVFNHEYDAHKFTTMQILVSKDGRYYIFTYTALNEIRSDEETYYAFHLKDAQKCIEQFKFVEKTSGTDETVEFTKDENGYLLYSDRDLCGFDLYVPNNFNLDYSSAIVSATSEDGSNVTMTKATATGVVVSKYFEKRKSELSAFVSDFTEIRVNETCEFGNANQCFCYEYTYRYNGKLFHVYQVLAVKGMSGYVFTYTATEENYTEHIDSIMNICDKVLIK